MLPQPSIFAEESQPARPGRLTRGNFYQKSTCNIDDTGYYITMNTKRLESIIKIHPRDNVAVALETLEIGTRVNVDGSTIDVREQVAIGHKIATTAISSRTPVYKYGWCIGLASKNIEPGEHVHVHNLETQLNGETSFTYSPIEATDVKHVSTHIPSATFSGYHRGGTLTGIRNEIWILPTVGCVARTCQKIAAEAQKRYGHLVDGVYAFSHPFGCSQLGDDLANTRQILASLASHPNAGAVLVVGLGCENNKIDTLMSLIKKPSNRLAYFNAQNVNDELESGLQQIEGLAKLCANDERSRRPLSELKIGLKCGGSDAFSGLTANPLVGAIATELAHEGGSPILTEIPEIFGAEMSLLSRAKDKPTFDNASEMINRFKRYFINHNLPISKNPSPGNIDGGITTLEEKSLGAVQKSGDALLTTVLEYGEQATGQGLALLNAPGNDAISSTALAASGAHIILFTTGRGTPLGFPVPTIKISSNAHLAKSKPNWIDFDSSVRLDGIPMTEVVGNLWNLILATCEGKRTKSEINDEREIAIWKSGVSL